MGDFKWVMFMLSITVVCIIIAASLELYIDTYERVEMAKIKCQEDKQ